MMRRLLSRPVFILGASLLVLGGCVGQSQPSRFYVLNSLATSETGRRLAAAENRIAIGIGPLELPKYLDRSQIVTRASPNQLDLADFDKWAEPLQDNFSRVLAENLSILLSTDRVVMFPWGTTPIDYQVAAEVTRFESQPGGDVAMDARWTVFGKDRKALVMKQSSFSEPVGAEGYEAIVSALSRALATLSRDIAAAIQAHSQRIADR
ncbi:MAG: membrane integrity-associated transporter subunit PqiC [Candidatus Methylomirabilales bacterium]